MRIQFAHLRELSTSGIYVDFAVFTGVKPTSDTLVNKQELLRQLVVGARSLGLKVDLGAFVYDKNGQTVFWGEPFAADFLKKRGVPQMTHFMDIDL